MAAKKQLVMGTTRNAEDRRGATTERNLLTKGACKGQKGLNTKTNTRAKQKGAQNKVKRARGLQT
jgi:hypothetical protein